MRDAEMVKSFQSCQEGREEGACPPTSPIFQNLSSPAFWHLTLLFILKVYMDSDQGGKCHLYPGDQFE